MLTLNKAQTSVVLFRLIRIFGHNHNNETMKKVYTNIVLALLAAFSLNAVEKPFVDFGPAPAFFDIEVHGLVGGSSITQNYMSSFPEISELDQGTGWSYGIGAAGRFGLRDYLSLGTEVNLLVNTGSTDMVVNRGDALSVSNVFLKNRYYYLNFPIFMSFNFNLASTVRWNVDGGVYYSYGIGGNQKQTIYNAKINEIGQLVTTIHNEKCGYFNDSRAFINSSRRSDVGLHLATGLTFNDRISVGGRAQIGLKNVANTVGVVKPNVHNLGFMFLVGYHF